MGKFDYKGWLIQRATQAKEDREAKAPISFQQYRNQQAVERWRERMAKGQGNTPPRVA